MLESKGCAEQALPVTDSRISWPCPLLDPAAGELDLPLMEELPLPLVLRRAVPTTHGRAGLRYSGVMTLPLTTGLGELFLMAWT